MPSHDPSAICRPFTSSLSLPGLGSLVDLVEYEASFFLRTPGQKDKLIGTWSVLE
jgi:hypothetical protein